MLGKLIDKFYPFFIVIVGLTMALAVMLTASGCGHLAENLKDKSVLAEAAGTGMKIVSVADPSTGTISPAIVMGVMDALFLDHKVTDGSMIYYKEQAATFNSSAKTITFVYIDKGFDAKITVEPGKIVNVPGLVVQSGDSTVNINTSTLGLSSPITKAVWSPVVEKEAP